MLFRNWFNSFMEILIFFLQTNICHFFFMKLGQMNYMKIVNFELLAQICAFFSEMQIFTFFPRLADFNYQLKNNMVTFTSSIIKIISLKTLMNGRGTEKKSEITTHSFLLSSLRLGDENDE